MDTKTINQGHFPPLYGLRRLNQEVWGRLKSVVVNLVLITIGSALCAVAINGILLPFEFQSGGFVGLTLIFHYVFNVLPISMLYLVMNIPVFALGWKYVGKRFFLYSCAGMLIFSLMVEWIHVPGYLNLS